jgi:carbamoyl-phosphate synthase large subunit
VYEGRPNPADLIVSGDVQLLINTPLGKLTQRDDYYIRRAALQHRVPYMTTMSAASAACDAVLALKSRRGGVRCLQEWYETTDSVMQGVLPLAGPTPQPRRGGGIEARP